MAIKKSGPLKAGDFIGRISWKWKPGSIGSFIPRNDQYEYWHQVYLSEGGEPTEEEIVRDIWGGYMNAIGKPLSEIGSEIDFETSVNVHSNQFIKSTAQG